MNNKSYLEYYSKLQPIEVVYRGSERIGWGRNRKIYDNNYDLEYNHRTILDDEVVFDFDDDNEDNNITNAKLVMLKLESDNINYSAWKTGGKGIHIHTFWDGLIRFKDLSLFKKTILKHYAYGMKIDYQLSGKHLVRAEFGLYEKNRKHNYKIPITDECILFNNVPQFIIDEYQKELTSYITRRMDNVNNDDITSDIKKLLEGEVIVEDGRERILFYLIHKLKSKFTKEELHDRLYSWYKYSGGSKLTTSQLKWKIDYHWNRNYNFSRRYFEDLLTENNKKAL